MHKIINSYQFKISNPRHKWEFSWGVRSLAVKWNQLDFSQTFPFNIREVTETSVLLCWAWGSYLSCFLCTPGTLYRSHRTDPTQTPYTGCQRWASPNLNRNKSHSFPLTPIYSCYILVYLTILQLYISINLTLWQLLIIIYLSLRQLVISVNLTLWQFFFYLRLSQSWTALHLCYSHSLTVCYISVYLPLWQLCISTYLSECFLFQSISHWAAISLGPSHLTLDPLCPSLRRDQQGWGWHDSARCSLPGESVDSVCWCGVYQEESDHLEKKISAKWITPLSFLFQCKNYIFIPFS